MRSIALVVLTVLGLGPALAEPLVSRAEPLVVVELFTSQGCSSCPPADALLAELARTDPTILPLDLHVTYWDRLGWKDPYSFAAVTERQRAYGASLRLDTVYTPQMVVAGRFDAVGSDRAAVLAAVARARGAPSVPLRVQPDAEGLRIEAEAGPADGPREGALLLVGYDPEHTTRVAAGENGGRTLREVNVVRSIVPVGRWQGAALRLQAARPLGERVALLLQTADGRIRGAAIPMAR